MNDIAFWNIIDKARTEGQSAYVDREQFLLSVREQLSNLQPEEVIEFQKTLLTQLDKTFHWDAVAAASIIFGDDCDRLLVDGFRYWIVAQGEKESAAIMANMDSLADKNLTAGEVYYYELGRIAPDVYEELTFDDFPIRELPPGKEEPDGEDFIRGDLLKRLPKLARDFGFLPERQPADGATVSQEEDVFAPISDEDITDEENPYAITD